jgi:hypothetical protein
MSQTALKILVSTAIREESHVLELKKSAPYLLLSRDRKEMLEQLRKIGQSSDLAVIVAAERFFVQNDLDRYANSTGMKFSLAGALEDFGRIEKHMAMVADPAQYHIINEAYTKKEHRIHGVPKDEARQAFSSHRARLANMDKSRLTDEEKAIIDARSSNIKAGEKLYEQMQAKAIGITLEQRKKPAQNRRRP